MKTIPIDILPQYIELAKLYKEKGLHIKGDDLVAAQRVIIEEYSGTFPCFGKHECGSIIYVGSLIEAYYYADDYFWNRIDDAWEKQPTEIDEDKIDEFVVPYIKPLDLMSLLPNDSTICKTDGGWMVSVNDKKQSHANLYCACVLLLHEILI